MPELDARVKAWLEADYTPLASRTSSPPPETRTASAAEYAAYHIGQLDQKMDRLIEAVEKLAAAKS